MGRRRASFLILPFFSWVLILFLWNASKAEKNTDFEVIHSVPDFPRIDFDDEDMVLFSGSTLHLRCESNRRVKWTTPKYKTEEGDYPDKLSFNLTMNKNPGYKYESHLEIKDLNVTDIGFYYCHYEENNDLTALDEIASIYVYVNDSKRLLATVESFLHLTPIQYQEITIPCKPSSPDVNITLTKDDEYIMQNDSGFIYDPKEGFTKRNPAVIDSGIYKCQAERGGNVDILNVVLTIHPHTNAVPKPIINDGNARHVIVGGELHLQCTVEMQVSVIFNLEWKTPNQKANETGRLEVSDAVSTKVEYSRFHYSLGSKVLTIRNVTKDDQGNYTCLVVDHTHKTNQAEKFIRVHEAHISYINFTIQGNIPEIKIISGEKSVQWVIDVAAHPHVKLEWFDPKEKQIIHTSTKYEIQSDQTQAMLKINNIEVSDAGIYQLKGINTQMEKTLNLSLIVYDAPAVELIGQLYYNYGEKHVINCSAIGYPIPEITWFFKSCGKKHQNCDRDYRRINESHYREIQLNSKGRKQSILEMDATETGYLQCLACNSVNCDNDTINFFVTDVPNGFEAYVEPVEPVIGDTVTLSCGASIYNYTDSIKWYLYNHENGKYENLEKKIGFNITTNTSNFSKKVEIKMYNVQFSHAGIYVCKAGRKDSDIFEEEIVNVTIQQVQKPIFESGSINNTYYYFDLGARLEWKCIVRGMPKPSIIWYKDGEILQMGKHKINLSNDNQTLSISYTNSKDEGSYTCKASNKGGVIERTAILEFNDKATFSHGILIGLIVFGVILLIVVVFLVRKNLKEKKLRKKLMSYGLDNFEEGALQNINPELGVDDQAELLPYDKKWEFPREKLKLGKQLGSGAFGVVMKADAYGIIEGEAMSTVAVKMVKRNAEYTHIRALASELKIMVHLGKHLNVVNLLGACTKNLTKRELLVIVEYCRFGNLQNYLLRHREDFIDQIDPLTGKVVPERGLDCENHLDTITSKGVKEDPRIKYAALSFSTSASSGGSQGSVQDYRAAQQIKLDNTPCLGATGQTVNTDMSFVSMSPSGDECAVTGGSSCEPDWRTNYRGDYGRRDVRPICTSDLICWAFQVARGIDYLASRRVLHGDLAARNILLAEDNVVKICDFGLAKSMYKSDNYQKKGDGPLPVKWMAIESIRDRVFSTQSDVWSFGIVLWEFFSLSRTPYPGMEADEKLYNKLIAGYRMEKPQYATEEIYSIMLECWKGQPSERPTFSDLTEKLGGMLEETVKRHYIDLNSPYLMMNTQQESTDYLGMMSEPSYANAMREMTPQRDYVNVPSPQPENPDLEYMTMSSPVPPNEDGVESESGYLCMRRPSNGSSPNPVVIFSPRPNPSPAFNFEGESMLNNKRSSPKLRPVETEGAEGPEMSPMLPINNHTKGGMLKKEDSLDSGMGSPSSYFNPTYRSLPNTNGFIIPNQKGSENNYVNVPHDKARQSDRSSGFLSEGGEVSPLPDKTLASFDIPLQVST